MKLPLREFADVLEGLQGPASHPSGSEQRSAARIGVTTRVELYVNNGGRWQTYVALTRDISISGLGLLQSLALDEGREVVIRLPRKRQPLYVAARVTHCRTLADGILAVGLEYSRRLTDAEITEMANQASAELSRLQHAILD
jgi:hypothetical protein